MNSIFGFASLDLFYIRIPGSFQTHLVLEKAKLRPIVATLFLVLFLCQQEN